MQGHWLTSAHLSRKTIRPPRWDHISNHRGFHQFQRPGQPATLTQWASQKGLSWSFWNLVHSLCFLEGADFWGMWVCLRSAACTFLLAGAHFSVCSNQPAVMMTLLNRKRNLATICFLCLTLHSEVSACRIFFFSSWNFWFFFSYFFFILPERALLEECWLSAEQFIKDISLSNVLCSFSSKVLA